MRIAEECPYITPCGWCSRQNMPCEVKLKKRLREFEKSLKKANESQKGKEVK